ncbi:MAG: signal peptidase I [Clostridiales bacterium]|nr:signal peptidase I [Clostridiales bacterium]
MSASKKGRFKDYQPLVIALVALLLAFLCSNYVFMLFRIVGQSMEPTLSENNWVVVSRLAYQRTSPHMGDLITFRKDDVTDEVLVKRVIGCPYDVIEIKQGELIINGRVVTASFASLPQELSMEAITIPTGSYFVLGDNHQVSNDSSVWDNPFVSEDDLIGKVSLLIYPTFEVLN